MAVNRVTPTGWLNETRDDVNRVTPSGWTKETTASAAPATFQAAWARNANTIIASGRQA